MFWVFLLLVSCLLNVSELDRVGLLMLYVSPSFLNAATSAHDFMVWLNSFHMFCHVFATHHVLHCIQCSLPQRVQYLSFPPYSVEIYHHRKWVPVGDGMTFSLLKLSKPEKHPNSYQHLKCFKCLCFTSNLLQI